MNDVFCKWFFSAWVAAMMCGAAHGAESYIIVDNQTGHILEAEKPTAKRQVASLTKMATAMVILDWAQTAKADLAQYVTIQPQAMRAGGINPAGLMPGDAVSVRDLLYCALMASDNIAAQSLAMFVGSKLPRYGDNEVDSFVAQMNALAGQLQMKRTRFLNPTGIDNLEGSLPFSTAADLARLTRYAYSRPAFPFYVSQKTREIHIYRLGQDLPILLTNTNQLLDQDGIDGVKTGRTAKAGDCIILSADRQPEVARQGETVYVIPRRIIAVVLGSPDRMAEGAALMNRGWRLYNRWAADGRKSGKRDLLDPQ